MPPLLPVLATVALVAVAVILFIVARPSNSSTPPTNPSDAATAQLVGQITALPTSELDQVGAGSASNGFKTMSEPSLSSGGKPEVLYIGAEYCPYCAAERWAMIVAFSRFGTFSGLTTTTSSASDVYPNTHTFTFRHASYSSQYLTLVTVETEDRNGKQLHNPTPAEAALSTKYASGGIPFVDFGNRLYFSGATYVPSSLQGLSWSQIADDLKQAGSPQAQAILGSANLITAAICEATSQQPAAVCSDPVIQGIQRSFPGA